jgi:hypothetical protein
MSSTSVFFPLAILCLVFNALTAPVSARIGETQAQCEARYGSPTNREELNDATTFTYEVDGRKVWVTFASGKAKAVQVAYKVKSDEEVLELLNRNYSGQWLGAGTKDYEFLGSVRPLQMYRSADGLLEAKLDRGLSGLSISNLAWRQAVERKAEAEEEAKTDKSLQGL